jgi:hypothetical protein
LRLAASIVSFVVVAGCAGQSGTSTSDCHGTSTSATKQVVTEVDGAPQSSGNAVELIPIAFLRAPGYSAWEVRALRPGTSAISVSGTCAAAGCAKPTLAFSLTIAVP